MPTTIDKVAKRAGVSKATVSRVMNNSKPVSAETRLRVIQAIEELKFKPNPAARTLVNKRSRTLGVVVTDISNLFVSVLVKGIEEIAYSSGYNIFICNSHATVEKEIEILMMLKDKRVDGIIFLTSQLREEHKHFFRGSSLPAALVNVSCDEDKLIVIRIDNQKASYDMTSYFMKKGYTRIGMILAPLEDYYSGRERFLGYQLALKDFGVQFRDDLVKTGFLEAMNGYLVTCDMIKNKTNFEALFVACDLMAFGAIKALIDNGFRVPEDIEVAGFDDVPMASFYHPTLTTVKQPIEDMGRLAAENLIKLVEGEDIEQWEVVLPHKIILRDSTAK